MLDVAEVLYASGIEPSIMWDRTQREGTELVPGLNPMLESICQRAMAKEPHLRHASAHELAEELAVYLRNVSDSGSASAGEYYSPGPARRPGRPDHHRLGTGPRCLCLLRVSDNTIRVC